VLFTLIGSEEVGISRSNLQSNLDDGTDPAVQRFSDLDRMTSHALNLPPGWAVRVMESVGNYGELFERNLGSGSSFKLERGPNDLWTRGGLLYAPPLR
jgi:general L-amino acid transport system substrate-binding protein